MAYKKQLHTALDRLDQGVARVHSLVKRGQNAHAIHFMENDLKELYEELQNHPGYIFPTTIIIDKKNKSKEFIKTNQLTGLQRKIQYLRNLKNIMK